MGVESEMYEPNEYLELFRQRAGLISQLSKSCSCGIKRDTVPGSDLGEGGGEEEMRRKRMIPTEVPIDFTCPDREEG